MQKRTIKVALLAVITTLLVLSFSTVALADQTWSDLPDTVTAKYGVTDNQIAAISDGYDGLWKPFQSITREQFTKMAVAAFDIPLVDAATASYTDVPKGSYYYQYIEGAKAAGVINGLTATTFGPKNVCTRQQALAIIARYVADVNGYDLATMYSADEITALLSHFGDAASISADLRDEMAFALDFGLTQGNNFGNLAPLANLTRIQGAVMLIRAQALVPPAQWTADKIELVTADKAENLIGQVHQVTFKVTTADGHPAIGVLVDFDTMYASEYYVGNISNEALLTNTKGEATINLISTEPGTQRVSASVSGVGTIYTTKYWLALDEIYAVPGALSAQNNAGTPHEWGVRVIVFGPGPRSTSQFDWYNALGPGFDPADIDVPDGVDMGDYWNYAYEQYLATQKYTPRTMAGIDVEWSIYDKADIPSTFANEAVVSVGNITAVDGAAITPAKTAVGTTDAAGYSKIKIESTVVGTTFIKAVATYAGNPYPKQLLNHSATPGGYVWNNYDWDDQPYSEALLTKTWIAHTIGGGTGPISPAYQAPNIGEEKTLTITLTDLYGNPVAGRAVEWFMQGVGFFDTDDQGDTKDEYVAAGNKDFDTTNAAGKASVFVKSYESGEQIVHAKYRDKGVGGAEGAWLTATAEVQWFDVDIATFDNITTTGVQVPESTGVLAHWDAQNEALSANVVSGSHTFDLYVYGLKLEYSPSVDEPDGQTPFIDSDAAGASYDGIFDSKDAAYFGGILMWNDDKTITDWWDDKVKNFYETSLTGVLPYDLDGDGKIERDNNGGADGGSDERGTLKVKINGQWLTLSFEGAYTQYDWDDDGYKEPFSYSTDRDNVPGIYIPLPGKTVTFTKANETAPDLSNLGAMFDGANTPAVGSFTPATAVTDANGKASVTVTSTVKGPETIKATVTWAGNPHRGAELLNAYAKKTWTAGTVGSAGDVTIEIYIDGKKVDTNKLGWIADGKSPAWTIDPETDDLILNSAHVQVHVLDAAGNDLADYEIVYLLEGVDSWLGGSQNAVDTFIPWSYLADLDEYNTNSANGLDYDMNGAAPDSDEPTPGSDPYASGIVGPGGTPAFFFNQWLGSEKPTFEGQAGLVKWFTRVPGMPYAGYYTDDYGAAYTYDWPHMYSPDLFYGFTGANESIFNPAEKTMWWPNVIGQEPTGPVDIYLATDGAKAWTLDGYVNLGEGVVKNIASLTGSNIDIQLAENPFDWSDHAESILRVMVYAPAAGLVQGGTPIYSTQVHQLWEQPVPTTITLVPATGINPVGIDHTVTATVKDQFGRPMPGVDVEFQGWATEGGSPYDGGAYANWNDFPGNPVVTDAAGTAVATSSAVAWSNWNIRAYVELDGPDLTSVVVTKYWAPQYDLYYEDNGYLLLVDSGLYEGTGLLDGRSFNVRLDGPTGTIIGSGVYDYDNGNSVVVGYQLEDGDRVWIEFIGDPLNNDEPNYIYDDVEAN